MSRKSNVRQLIRYVLDLEKTGHKVTFKENPFNVRGIALTETDKKYLRAELMDVQLLKLFLSCNGDIDQFMKAVVRSKENLPVVSIKQNVRARTINGIIKSFERNEDLRVHQRKDSVKAHHTILSFSAKDTPNLTDEILKDIARHYISLRGIENMYVGSIHTDKDHLHVHIVMSGTQVGTGLSSRISRMEFQNIKQAMQQYQKEKYPQLVYSLPEHGGRKNERTSVLKNLKNAERAPYKSSLLELLETTYSKSRSSQHFLEQIQRHGHEPYFRNGKLQGVRYDGDLKFRFSRLGFDEKKLNELDAKRDKQNKEMEELRNIRNRGREIEALSRKDNIEIQESAIGADGSKVDETYELGVIREHGNNSQERELGENSTIPLSIDDEESDDNNNYKQS